MKINNEITNELINIISFISITCSILFVFFGFIYIKTKEKYKILGYINISLFTFVMCSLITVLTLGYHDSNGLKYNKLPDIQITNFNNQYNYNKQFFFNLSKPLK